jgi:hypothetical protein
MLRLSPSNFSDLNQVLNAFQDINTFVLEPGDYHLTDTLDIVRPNVTIIGSTNYCEDVHIFQNSPDKNAINIKADNVCIKFVSVHAVNGTGVCLLQSNSNWVSVNHCTFYGPSNDFAVNFAGRSTAVGTLLEKFNSNEFDHNNSFDYNIVYSQNSNNGLSIYMQRDFSSKHNVIRGGRIMLTLCRSIMVSDNRIYDSPSNGLLCNLPSDLITIEKNQFKDCTLSSIVVKPLEEGMGPLNYNLEIKNNKIRNSKYFGIELNQANQVKVIGNEILWTTDFAIYVLRSTGVEIGANICSHFRRGIVADVENDAVDIHGNQLYSVFPDQSEYGIMVETTAVNITVEGNHLSGEYLSGEIKDIDETNTVQNNTVSKHHSYNKELTLI